MLFLGNSFLNHNKRKNEIDFVYNRFAVNFLRFSLVFSIIKRHTERFETLT